MSNERHDHSRKRDCHLGGESKHSTRCVDEKPAETCDDLACELSCRTVRNDTDADEHHWKRCHALPAAQRVWAGRNNV